MTTIYVHGYNFPKGKNAEHQYCVWDKFNPDPDTIRFSWVSRPSGGPFGAWLSGYRHTYDWAWAKAEEAGDDLADILDNTEGRSNIICHSLGSRVSYHALMMVPDKINIILTLNGADSNKHARDCFDIATRRAKLKRSPLPRVFCIYTMHDDVLDDLGQWFSPKLGAQKIVGLGGLSEPVPYGWTNIDLGKAGDGEGYGDHDWSFRNPDNHALFRKILEDNESVLL